MNAIDGRDIVLFEMGISLGESSQQNELKEFHNLIIANLFPSIIHKRSVNLLSILPDLFPFILQSFLNEQSYQVRSDKLLVILRYNFKNSLD